MEEKDKKGRKRLFDRIRIQAMEDREQRLAEKHARFDLQKEEEKLFQSLCNRRDGWPEESRPEFVSVLTRCVSRIAKGDEPAPQSTTAKEESQQRRE